MDPVEFAVLEPDRGLQGNANRGGRRQVTIISRERWAELMAGLDADLDPSARRANLMVSGIDLQETRGLGLRVGTALLRIKGETRPCEQMDDAQEGLRKALQPRWRAGAYGEIVEGGVIQLGDSAEWVS
jgi:MOSC domain-containing protein YiiM